jgi:hypothetical protein
MVEKPELLIPVRQTTRKLSIQFARCKKRSKGELTYLGLRSGSFGGELKRRNVSKAGDCGRGHRVIADADNDGGVSRLKAQPHVLRWALTPGRIRCLFCDR